MLSWEITADWRHDPNLQTDVEIRFIPQGNDSTRARYQLLEELLSTGTIAPISE